MPALKSHQLKSKLGFTLIELLVVISIIGVLATFIVASFNNARIKGRDARRKADLDAIKKALELVRNDCTGARYYPDVASGTDDVDYQNLRTYLSDPDINVIRLAPNDPNQTGTNNYWYTQTGGTAVAAVCPDDAPPSGLQNGYTRFVVRALLENANDPEIAGSLARCSSSGATAVARAYYVCGKQE